MGNIISCVYYKEIDICYLGELFHKVSGKESNKVVFTGTDTIVLEFRVNSPWYDFPVDPLNFSSGAFGREVGVFKL